MKTIFKETAIVLFVCLVFALYAILFTPYPAASVIHGLFSKGGPAKAPDNYETIQKQIDVSKDLTYSSYVPNSKYDLITPKEGTDFPVILWVHGGAYVGGQKEDVSIYTNMLASEGYAVVNMEYDLAPNSKYPSPLIQLTDLYTEIAKIASDKRLDLSKLILAGDSAGGQIVAQFANIQLNDTYSERLSFPQVIPKESIQGMILLCAPFSLKELGTPSNILLKDFFIQRIGWAYTGKTEWHTSDIAKEADLLNVVTGDFPPTFISDANTFSFEKQGKAFAKLLESQGTKVTTVFYPKSKGKITHEYQLDMSLKESKQTYKKLTEFLKGLID